MAQYEDGSADTNDSFVQEIYASIYASFDEQIDREIRESKRRRLERERTASEFLPAGFTTSRVNPATISHLGMSWTVLFCLFIMSICCVWFFNPPGASTPPIAAPLEIHGNSTNVSDPHSNLRNVRSCYLDYLQRCECVVAFPRQSIECAVNKSNQLYKHIWASDTELNDLLNNLPHELHDRLQKSGDRIRELVGRFENGTKRVCDFHSPLDESNGDEELRLKLQDNIQDLDYISSKTLSRLDTLESRKHSYGKDFETFLFYRNRKTIDQINRNIADDLKTQAISQDLSQIIRGILTDLQGVSDYIRNGSCPSPAHA